MGNDPLLYSFVGLGAGIFLVAQGFRWLRQKKLIEEVPTSKIRSIAMGLVEIKAKVVKEKTMLKSPFSNKDCVYWKYNIERWQSTKNGGHWVSISKGSDMRPFYVKDNTGEVLIDPVGATMDIPPDFTKVASGSSGLPASLVKFCNSKAIKTSGFFSGRKRYREWYLAPDDDTYILGTAGKNPHVKNIKKNEEGIMIQKGENEKFYYISDKPEENLLKTFKWKVFGGLLGGSLLTLGCLAYILFRFGLF